MQPERKKLGEMGALGALIGLIVGLAVRWAIGGGLGTVLLCGAIGIAGGVAVSLLARKD